MGWVVGPKPLIAALRTMHAYATFCAPTPLQLGVAAALTKIADDADAATRSRAASAASLSPEERNAFSFGSETRRREAAFACTRGCLAPDSVARVIASNVAVLSRALVDSGVAPFAPSGGYFLVADVASTGLAATEYCRALATGPARVAAVPMDVFFDAKDSAKDVPEEPREVRGVQEQRDDREVRGGDSEQPRRRGEKGASSSYGGSRSGRPNE